MIVVLIVLAIGQIIGWGTIGLPPVVGREIAADLGIDIVEVFAGTSVLYVVMSLCAPALANTFGRHGARRVMIGGAAIAVPGFVVLGISRGEVSYFAAWVILGIAGSACLSTATYILVAVVVVAIIGFVIYRLREFRREGAAAAARPGETPADRLRG